jgi:hypothetical protein
MHTEELYESVASALRAIRDPNFPLAFTRQGPTERLKKTGPTPRKSSDGQHISTTWQYGWFVPFDQNEREAVRRWVKWVLQHSNSWTKAGVWMFETERRENARCVIRYIPNVKCGGVAGAVGCTQHGAGPDGQTLVTMQNGLLRDPSDPQGRWKGLLHELAHDAFFATHGPPGTPYTGVMGNGDPGIWPSKSDIASVRNWLAGQGKIKH